MRPIKITEKLNYVPIKIRMMFGDTELAIGTAFFYRHLESTHLVTNWHNVTGRNPKTKQPISSHGGVPDRMTIGIPQNINKDGQAGILWNWKTLRLYEDENMEKPIWHEHPEFRETVDVVTIPLNGLEETALMTANDSRLALDNIRLYPSLDVFVLGFPLGMSGGAHFPIWKRGSIATEPDVNLDNLPKLFIDTATREGMSGSPVYVQEVGYWIPEDKTDQKDAVIGKGKRFVGIYSGRVGDDSFQAQLGIVWKARAIEEIIEASKNQA
jgi:hypothetical protein